jgi:hypothetical protein
LHWMANLHLKSINQTILGAHAYHLIPCAIVVTRTDSRKDTSTPNTRHARVVHA